MKLRRLFSLAALVTASLLLIGTESRAESFTVPSTLQVDDKTFDFLRAVTGGTQPQPLSGITLNPETVGTGGSINAPFGFSLQGPIVLATNSGTSDLTLTYTVTSPPDRPITAVTLTGVGGATPGTGGFVRIDENISAGGNVIPAVLNGSGSITIPLGGSFTTIGIVKDILASAGPGADSTANYTFVSQTFTQVPEPASLALLGVGLIGIPALHRIQRKRKLLVV